MTELTSIYTFEQTGLDADKGTPERIGQTYFATDTSTGYIATGTASSADWKPRVKLTSTKGQMLVGTASGWELLTVGTDGSILQADSAQSLGVKWTALGTAVGKKMAKMVGYPSSAITAPQAINYQTEEIDNDAMIDVGGNPTRITIKTAGVYRITANGKWAITSGGVNWYLRKNGTDQLTTQQNVSGTSISPVWIIDEIFSFAVNDYVEVYVPSTTGGGVSRSANQFDWTFSATEV